MAVSEVAVVSEPAITAIRPSERMIDMEGFTGSNPSSSVFNVRHDKHDDKSFVNSKNQMLTR
jgi:hypothetical protein